MILLADKVRSSQFKWEREETVATRVEKGRVNENADLLDPVDEPHRPRELRREAKSSSVE